MESGTVESGNRAMWFIRLMIGTVLAVALMGGIIAFIRQQFGLYLIVLSPILMGGLAGAMATTWRTRFNLNIIVTGLIGILIGLLTYGAYRVADYLFFINRLSRNVPTFAEYTELQALVGVSITRIGRSTGADLTGNLVYLYWIAEMVLVVVGVVLALRQANKSAAKPVTSGQ